MLHTIFEPFGQLLSYTVLDCFGYAEDHYYYLLSFLVTIQISFPEAVKNESPVEIQTFQMLPFCLLFSDSDYPEHNIY